MSLNFSWGNPIAVKDAFASLGVFSQIVEIKPYQHEYISHDPQKGILEDILKEYLLQTMGKKYHLMITPGGLSGVTIATDVLSADGRDVEYDSLHFSFYQNALRGTPSDFPSTGKVFVTASPSNPEGTIRNWRTPIGADIILDMAYGTLVYSKVPYIFPEHTIAVGSLGKTLGLPGLRLGWIATEDYSLLEKCWQHMLYKTIGYSSASYQMALALAPNNHFLTSATRLAGSCIDNNREEFQRLEFMTEERSVPENGMFWWTYPSKKMISYFEEIGLIWTPGEICGGSPGWIRLNLAHNRETTKAVVDLILKLDRI